jgi:hypothetical protein
MKKVILGVFILVCLGWIAFFSLETLGVSNSFDPVKLFGEQDEKLLIVNRQNEIPPGSLEELYGSPCEELYNDLNDSSLHKCFISISQPHMLLLNRSGWNAKKVDRLFKTLEIKNLIESQGTFEVGKYEGRYMKQGLYLAQKGFESEGSDGWNQLYDKKASASIIKLNSNEKVTDIYLKGANRFDYITKVDSLPKTKQVDDEELFSRFISNQVISYHFNEREFYLKEDSIYASSPMHEWLNKGFVVVETSSGRAIISDYVLGQDPVLNLRDKEQNDTSNIFTTPLTKSFPRDNGSYQIDYLEDLVVISESRTVIDQLLADTKLGKTISSNEILRTRLYGNLPHNVSERFVNAQKAYSKAAYNGFLLEARTNQVATDNSVQQKKSFSMNVGARIIDFEVLSGEGNVVCHDQNNNLLLFLNGIREWTKKLPAKIEHIQALDIYANGDKIICAQTYNEIFLLNKQGQNVGSFPIKLEQEITSKVKFYRWKGSGFFVFGTNDGKGRVYDMQGREIRVINIGVNATRQVDAWASQGRLFYGFANSSSFYMYDADKRKMHRNFALDNGCIAGRMPNEIYQYGLTGNSLFKYDQKGTKTELTDVPQGKILKVFDENKNPVIVVKSANEIKLMNAQGLQIGSVTLPFNEVADVDITITDNGKTLLSVIDGLENNVYLYRVGGDVLLVKPLEGQQKVDFRLSSPKKKITTIVDQFIVQYFEN